jgi:hypothetical protein
MVKTHQLTLDGKKLRVQKGFLRRVMYVHRTYRKKAGEYEEVFRDLMRYKVIRLDEIENIEDFRQSVKSHDTRNTVSDLLIDNLMHTFEFKEMIIEKIRHKDVTLKSGKTRKGLYLEKINAYLFIDKKGVLRARDLKTGRFTGRPDFYDMVPLHEISRL